MHESEDNKNAQEKIAQANPNPVITTGKDGALQFVNQAASKLAQHLGLEQLEYLLPVDHDGLVKACLNTGETLTAECEISDHKIAWSYQSTADRNVVCIYGYDVTAYQAKATSLKDLPESNPNPVLIYRKNGKIQFSNVAVSMLLDDLGLENVEDILPFNHDDLVKSCLDTSLPVDGDRHTCGHSIVWSYKLPDSGEAVYIYGCDISQHLPKDFSETGLPTVNPNPVLTVGPDGMPRFTNNATLQLLLDLELINTDEILPPDHKGMVKACQSTNTPLTMPHEVRGKILTWSYIPVDFSDVIYIYGYDITEYRKKASKN